MFVSPIPLALLLNLPGGLILALLFSLHCTHRIFIGLCLTGDISTPGQAAHAQKGMSMQKKTTMSIGSLMA